MKKRLKGESPLRLKGLAPCLGLAVVLDRLAVDPHCDDGDDDEQQHHQVGVCAHAALIVVEGVLLSETIDVIGTVSGHQAVGVLALGEGASHELVGEGGAVADADGLGGLAVIDYLSVELAVEHSVGDGQAAGRGVGDLHGEGHGLADLQVLLDNRINFE